jgi:hypothetical protein
MMKAAAVAVTMIRRLTAETGLDALVFPVSGRGI